MNDSLIARYRRWFDCEKESHRKTLDSLKAVSEEQRESEEFRKAVYLMGHIVAARRVWLFRLGVVKEKVELFPGETRLDELPAQIEGNGEAVVSVSQSTERCKTRARL